MGQQIFPIFPARDSNFSIPFPIREKIERNDSEMAAHDSNDTIESFSPIATIHDTSKYYTYATRQTQFTQSSDTRVTQIRSKSNTEIYSTARRPTARRRKCSALWKEMRHASYRRVRDPLWR